jgi:hypothetical protein
MLTASGCCFLSRDTGRVMLQQRSKEVSHPLLGVFGEGNLKRKNVP